MLKWCVWSVHTHIVVTFDPQGSKVVIPLQVQLTGEDRWLRVNISCPLIKRSSDRTRLIPTREWRRLMSVTSSLAQLCTVHIWSRCSFVIKLARPPFGAWLRILYNFFTHKWCCGVIITCHLQSREGFCTTQFTLSSPALPGNCDIERALRVDCGHRSISSDTCYKLGCCYDARDSTCYYRLNGKINIGLIYYSSLTFPPNKNIWSTCLLKKKKKSLHFPACRRSLQPALWMDTLCFR